MGYVQYIVVFLEFKYNNRACGGKCKLDSTGSEMLHRSVIGTVIHSVHSDKI